MTKLIAIATLLFSVIFLSPNVVLSETIEWDDLVKRNGLYYKKFTDVPFTGKISGEAQGSFKNGKKDGAWVSYWSNGQLHYKGNYKNGKQEGEWVSYHKNGQLWYKHNYKNGEKEGEWVSYYDNGQLLKKGNYKNGKREGKWVYYSKTGKKEFGIKKFSTIILHEGSGLYKNGKKISD